MPTKNKRYLSETPPPKGRQGVTNVDNEFAASFPVLYSIGKFIDPTGVSGYGDVKESVEQYDSNPTAGTAYNATMETLGAIPFLGKVPKLVKAAQFLINGRGLLKDYDYAKQQQALYNNELVVDYWDNTVKTRREAVTHGDYMRKNKVSYTDANHLPAFRLAPKGSKRGDVINGYKINSRVLNKYKK